MQVFDQLRDFLKTAQYPLIAILGPTASGKTALSLKIAKIFNGEIISADSRQLYKYMDIGTDKILLNKQEGIKHHLLDFLEPDQPFTLADFKRSALKIIEEIYRRKKLPILCGGTGLYLNAVLQNYQIPAVAPNWQLRNELEAFYKTHGAEKLYQKLVECDPKSAARIHPNNIRYVIRALEINMVGKTNKQTQKGDCQFDVFNIGITWPREILYERINKRVDDQISRGFLNEVKTLLMKGYHPNLPSMSSLGYKEIIAHLNGDFTLEQALEEIKKNTRNYAKRQITWFKRDEDINWVNGEDLKNF